MVKLTAEDLQYVQREVESVSPLMFGDRPWEAHLISQEAKLGVASLGRHMLDRVLERTKTDAPAARMLRNMLALIFAPLYHARKFSLPNLAADRLSHVYSAYPQPEPHQKSALEVDVDVAMHEVSPAWQVLFERNIPKITSSADRHFLYCCAKLALVYACQQEQGLDPELLKRLKEASDAVKEVGKLRKALSQESDQGLLPVTDTGVTFDDVAGCHASKNRITRLAVLLAKPEIAKRWGMKLPGGILLVGPPGNGKTLMVQALATHLRRPLFRVDMSKILSKWYGESIQSLAEAFAAARKAKGAILFFDEADGIVVNRRGQNVHEESRRVVGQFNIEMDATLAQDNLLVVLATNIQEELDEAAVRDQRIDKVIRMPNPDLSERIEVLDLHIKAAIKKASIVPFSGPLVLRRLAALTEGLSSSALAGIIQLALNNKGEDEARGLTVTPVTQEDLETAIRVHLVDRKTEHKRIGFASPEPAVETIEILPNDDLSSLLDPLV